MGPTRKRDLAAAVAVATVLGYLIVHLVYRWFPPITGWSGLSLAVVAAVEAGWARFVRVKIDDGRIGAGPGRLHPLVVARGVVIAKASAWMGALVLGFWLGVLGYLLPRRPVLRVAEQDTGGAVAAAAGALLLLIAALWLEHCCKSPQDPGDPTAQAGNQLG